MTPPPRKPTPPPLHEFADGDDDKTPISNDPFVSIDHHTRSAAKNTKSALGEIQAIHAKLDNTIARHDQTQAQDEREHRALSQGMSSLGREIAGLKARQDIHDEKLDGVDEKVTRIELSQHGVTGKLDIIVDDIRATKRIEEHKAKVTIETAAIVQRTEIQDAADSKKVRRARSVKILGIVGGIVGSGGILATLIAALAGSADRELTKSLGIAGITPASAVFSPVTARCRSSGS